MWEWEWESGSSSAEVELCLPPTPWLGNLKPPPHGAVAPWAIGARRSAEARWRDSHARRGRHVVKVNVGVGVGVQFVFG